MGLTENEKNIIKAVRESAQQGKDLEIRTDKKGNHKVLEITKRRIVG